MIAAPSCSFWYSAIIVVFAAVVGSLVMFAVDRTVCSYDVSFANDANDALPAAVTVCPPVPLCESGGSGSFWTCTALRLGHPTRPFWTHCDRQATKAALLSSLSHLYGHDLVRGDLVQAILAKLERPDEPLVLHLAGDNGVGKTRCAELIASALCVWHNRENGHDGVGGDCMTSISGASYVSGSSASDIRADETPLGKREINITASILRAVARHAANYPHGIVLFNDFTALSPSVARAVSETLFFSQRGDYDSSLKCHSGDTRCPGTGWNKAVDPSTKRRSSGIAETHVEKAKGPSFRLDGSFDPSKMLFILTSDRGTEGRTLGLSVDDTASLADQDLRIFLAQGEGEQKAFASWREVVRTVPFVPLDRASALRIVAHNLAAVSCEGGPLARHIANVTYDSAVLSHVVDAVFHEMVVENGRAVAKATQALTSGLVRGALQRYLSQSPSESLVHLHFFLDSRGSHRVIDVAILRAGGEDL